MRKMRRLAANWLIIAAIALAAPVARDSAAADPLALHEGFEVDAPKLVSDVCSKCHGMAGVSISPLFPNLAAQQPGYITTELQLFRQRGRSDPRARAFMWGIARGLNDDQIEALAKYFSSQPPARGKASSNPALAAKGKSLYENGAPERDIPGCTICHGPNAEGINTFPRLAGQHRDYLVTQLRQFHTRLRESDIMEGVAKNLTEDEISAVAEYLASK